MSRTKSGTQKLDGLKIVPTEKSDGPVEHVNEKNAVVERTLKKQTHMYR